jgi:hypothetical protein
MVVHSTWDSIDDDDEIMRPTFFSILITATTARHYFPIGRLLRRILEKRDEKTPLV